MRVLGDAGVQFHILRIIVLSFGQFPLFLIFLENHIGDNPRYKDKAAHPIPRFADFVFPPRQYPDVDGLPLEQVCHHIVLADSCQFLKGDGKWWGRLAVPEEQDKQWGLLITRGDAGTQAREDQTQNQEF